MSLGALLTLALAASAPAPESASAAQGVSHYPAAFFAPSQPTTALDMVQRLPGFVFDPGAQVRGFADAGGNVLIDGERPVEKTDGLDQILLRIPAADVLRIDLIRGGAPGIDMQGKTLIANVIRKRGGGAQAVLAASATAVKGYGLGWGVRADGSGRLGAAAIDASLLLGKGFDDGTGDGVRTARSPSGALVGAGPEQSLGVAYNYKATFGLSAPLAGGKLRLDSSVFSGPYDYRQLDTLTPAGSAFEHDRQSQKTAEVGLRWDRDVGAKAKLEAYALQQVGQSGFVADLVDSGSAITLIESGQTSHYDLEKKTAESIGRLTLTWTPSGSLSIESGGEADFNWMRDRTTYVQDGAAVAIPAANVVVTELRGDGFVTATWQARKTLTLEASLRAEVSRIAASGDVAQSKTLFYPKPRGVLTWSAGRHDQLRLRIEREVGQLNFDDFAASNAPLSNGGVHAGNPNLRPQTDWVAEAAFDHRFWGGADATLTLRHLWLADVIDRIPIFDPAGDYDAPGNIGAGSQSEAAFTLTLPTDRLGLARGVLSGQATWRASRVIDPTTGAPRPISGLHPLDGELHFSQSLPRWKAKWGFDILDQWEQVEYRFDEIDTDKLKTWVALFAEYNPRADVQIRFELDNAGARSFEHGRQVYAGPRNASPLLFDDVRALHFGREFYLRVRKSFG